MQFIDLKKQREVILSSLEKRIAQVFEHGRYIQGPEVNELEKRLSAYTGVKRAIACGNGTDAIQIALMSLSLQPGDEIITTPFSFIATCEMILLLQLKPVFVDIKADTYHIDPAKIEEKITGKTKAILPVSLYGQCAEMESINAIAVKWNLPVIEDAAQSFGAEYKGKKSCNLSTIGTTSFFPSKPLGAYGDGGMMFTNDEEVGEKLRKIANHGEECRYQHTMIGINSRLDSLQAAVLLAKMEIFEQEITNRQKIGARYTEALKTFVKTPIVKEGGTHVYAQYTIEVENRALFCQKMKEAGIPTAVHYPLLLPFQPIFNCTDFKKGDFPIAENASKHVVSLPMHPYLEENTQDYIIKKVKELQ